MLLTLRLPAAKIPARASNCTVRSKAPDDLPVRVISGAPAAGRARPCSGPAVPVPDRGVASTTNQADRRIPGIGHTGSHAHGGRPLRASERAHRVPRPGPRCGMAPYNELDRLALLRRRSIDPSQHLRGERSGAESSSTPAGPACCLDERRTVNYSFETTSTRNDGPAGARS